MASQVAERYGQALFELAKESGELVRWGQQARCLAAVVEENPQLLDFFNAVKISAEEKAYQKIPVINDFKDRNGNDIMMQQIQRNYDQIKADAQAIINEEMRRIKNDPELRKRLGLEDEKGNDPDKS